jgi:hypothetical protein
MGKPEQRIEAMQARKELLRDEMASQFQNKGGF